MSPTPETDPKLPSSATTAALGLQQQPSSSWKEMAATLFVPQFADLALRTGLGITFVLYILNQRHMLPRPLAFVVSKVLFYPTLPITAARRIGNWLTRMDETVVLGGAPFALLNYPSTLKNEYGVTGVINMCKEWRGPTKRYQHLGIEELYLPTVDHFEPSQEDLISALSFLQRHEAKGNSVYVHCRAGHGRSGAVAYAWALLKGYPESVEDPETLNADLRKIRKIRPGLWKQPNLRALRERLVRSKGSLVDLNDAFFEEQQQQQQQQPPSRDNDNDNETKKDL